MVFYCVVPGCKTNRKGYLKLSLFSVPKDDERKKKWEEGICINNLQRSKHRVCEKHFLPENIIRSTEHRDSEGNVIAILPLQCFKLTEDAVPSLAYGNNCEKVINAEKSNDVTSQNIFENVFSDITNQISSPDNDNNDSVSTTTGQDINSKAGPKIIEINNFNHNLIIKKSDTLVELPKNLLILKRNCKGSINSSIISQLTSEKQTIFKLLCENINLIKLPIDWICHIPSNKNCIVLAEIYVNNSDNESYNGICTIKRSLVIKNTMKFSYSAMGKNIDSEQLNLKNTFENLEDLQITLNKFSNALFCSGIADIEGVDLVKDNVGSMDCFNKLRHNNCQILSLRRKCKMCDNVRKTVNQRKRRMSRRNPADKKRTSYSNIVNKDVLNSCRKRIQAQEGMIKRAKNRIGRLRKQVNEMKAGLSKVDVQSVLDKCSEYQIPDIQRTLIEQIISSAKVKSEKGRRYNEDWIMLCVLMHTRSPKEYKHLQSLGILPLPCVRTIRRYLKLISQFDAEESFEKVEETDFEDIQQTDNEVIGQNDYEDIQQNDDETIGQNDYEDIQQSDYEEIQQNDYEDIQQNDYEDIQQNDNEDIQLNDDEDYEQNNDDIDEDDVIDSNFEEFDDDCL